jgi:MinD-like ATPase involved in chromosome partitioning or flagellar assembly
MSSVITFYSYKGGVGRSMALSNVAVLLARRGLRVLAVDWDLEAPGLERYFNYFDIANPGSGLLRLLMAARDHGPTNFAAYTSIIDCGAPHPITLLASGREQDDAYSTNLEAFDWGEFFAKGGGAFIEGLREEWRRSFDIILIDSRTGLSDSGGICTIQLPDAVVAMFTANHQSLYGVRDVMRLAQKARQSLAYDRMPLSVLPLPSRWGVQEFQETQIWLDRVVDGVKEFFADWLPRSINPRQVVEAIKIPHHSYFGFGERLAVAEQGTTDPTGLGFVYDKVAAFLASDFKDLTPLVGAEAARAPEAIGLNPPSVQEPADYEYDVFVSYDGANREAIVELVDAIRRELHMVLGYEPRMFMDVTEIRIGELWQETKNALIRSKVMLALFTPRYFSREWSQREFQTMLQRNKLTMGEPPLVPVLLSGNPRDFPRWAIEYQWLDMRDVSLLAMSKVAPSRRSSKWHRAVQGITDALDRKILAVGARVALP